MLSKTRPRQVIEESLVQKYQRIRHRTLELVAPLEIEDFVIQPMADVSPPKWHLAHTTWFFEHFILKAQNATYQLYHETYSYLFNSYYETVGDRWTRAERGLLSRPTVREVLRYREYVDQHMGDLLEQGNLNPPLLDCLELGLHHEQQHQELLIYDLKYILGINPLFPVYTPQQPEDSSHSDGSHRTGHYRVIAAGTYTIGFGGEGFCFDNEKGVHEVTLAAYGVADRLTTNQDYLEFIDAGGYQDFRHWLSDGWTWVNEQGIHAPLYWQKREGAWCYYTLSGLRPIHPDEPVTHISLFEADAYASWAGKRLLTEFEWEVAAREYGNPSLEHSNFLDRKVFHPQPGNHTQFFGDVWEWTNSAYLPYPYYQKAAGALGEYNGKFMINQMVLRGGSCATPQDHFRPTYRNFFQPHLRWLFAGIRLAETL